MTLLKVTDKFGIPITVDDYVLIEDLENIYQIISVRSEHMVLLRLYYGSASWQWAGSAHLIKIPNGPELTLALLKQTHN